MTEAPILLVLLPFAASLLCLVNKLFPRRSFAPVLGVLATILSLALLGLALPRVLAGGFFPYHLGGWMEPVGIALRLDGLAWISSVIATTVALSALVYSLGEHAYGQYFYFFFLIMIAGMQGVILTGDLFNMFVFLEILSIATYVLVAYPGKRTSLLASFRYLLISSLGLAFSLLGVLILYAETGTLSLRLIAAAFQDGSTLEPSCVLGVTSFVVGVAVKAALMPLHTWLPDAHAYAPHPVSAILSGVMIKVSFLAVWRVVTVLGLSRLQDLLPGSARSPPPRP